MTLSLRNLDVPAESGTLRGTRVNSFRPPRDQIVFAAFAGWDAAGAKRFGYPTFWVNRMQAPPEELGVRPDASGTSLADLIAFVTPAR